MATAKKPASPQKGTLRGTDPLQARLAFRAKPNARKTALLAKEPEGWVVAIAAPPVDGAANDELTAFLAKLLRQPKSTISFQRGESGRHKMVVVTGLSTEDAAALLDATLPEVSAEK